ncbi:hypothetical protein RCL_jg5650.t1 [Rhizophagus clarus]|uniref:Uncharacterized protein n=1 Tax=Rhizophagus clarus TaxID=94130 RepID=A0A8H3R0B9_9GLOM|nr:hypothetical protein RCL_jg5650.t1 [Rhizophagus clarus]
MTIGFQLIGRRETFNFICCILQLNTSQNLKFHIEWMSGGFIAYRVGGMDNGSGRGFTHITERRGGSNLGPIRLLVNKHVDTFRFSVIVILARNASITSDVQVKLTRSFTLVSKKKFKVSRNDKRTRRRRRKILIIENLENYFLGLRLALSIGVPVIDSVIIASLCFCTRRARQYNN